MAKNKGKQDQQSSLTKKVSDKQNPSNAIALSKIPTGIANLDKVLDGGVPKNRSTLIIGGPGTGKTVFGLELLYLNAIKQNPGLFISFEEEKESILMNAMTFGWDLQILEQGKKISVLDGTISPDAIIAGNFNIQGLLTIIGGQAKRINARIIVIDAIDVMLRLFNDPLKERNELYVLHDWLKSNKMTSIITMKRFEGDTTLGCYAFLEYITDCVIHLDQRIYEQVNTRRLRILKYRGSTFGSNEYPYIINENGVVLIPITDIALTYDASGLVISSGHKKLDHILGDGFRSGSSILINGASGTGKTTILSSFVQAVCKHGEKVLYINLEESQPSLITCMKSAGIDLQACLETNCLHIESIMPESTGAEQHLIHIFNLIDTIQPDHVIFEAVSACERLGSTQTAFNFIMRLIHECKHRNITCLLSNQLEKGKNDNRIGDIGLSSVIDTLISLHYTLSDGKIHRALVVEKSRGMHHSNQFWEYEITDDGVMIHNPVIITDNYTLKSFRSSPTHNSKNEKDTDSHDSYTEKV